MSYRGIPYAKQPIDDLRFQPLVAPDPWTDAFDASTEGPVCPQNTGPYGLLFQPQAMDEACIHVNVHVPLKETTSSLPVFVYIHGGSFIYGSGDSDLYGPEYLMTKDVILVTFNYRIDVLGFLFMNSAEVPGNQGIKDMVFLLKWVQENIAAFGGDPSKVTIGGQSAGSAAGHILTLSSLADGLFQRAILQSGSSVSSYINLDQTTAKSLATTLGTTLGIDTTSDTTLLAGLKAASWSELLNATAQMTTSFGTVKETVFDNVAAVLTEDPEVIIKSGTAKKIPQIIGTTSSEGGAYLTTIDALGVMPLFAADPTLLVPDDIQLVASENVIKEIADKLVVRYFGSVANISGTTSSSYAQLLGERGDSYPVIKQATLNNQYLPDTTYLYVFSFVGENNLVKNLVSGKRFPGAVHADDLNYIFKANAVNETFVSGSKEETVKSQMLELWSNFIKTGDPSSSIVTWPKTDANLSYLNIGEELTVSQNPLADVKTFYDELYASAGL